MKADRNLLILATLLLAFGALGGMDARAGDPSEGSPLAPSVEAAEAPETPATPAESPQKEDEDDGEKEDAEKEDAEKEDAEKEDAEKEDAEKEDAKKDEPDKDPDEPLKGSYTEAVTVTTATRRETEIMKTPVAVTAIGQEELDRQGIQDVTGLADLVPNMDVSIINGQSTPIIALRGVRSTNETELGDPAVGVHLDGIYTPRMQGALALMFDNERVEVLRGPQGTLFGRNSTVGSINIITAKPKLDSYDGRVWFQYGNYNATELQTFVNVPVSDTFGFRFAGRTLSRDSFVDGYWDPNQYDQRFIGQMVSGAQEIAPGPFEDCTSPECFTRTQHSNWWADDLESPIRELVPADEEDFYFNAEEWAYRISGLWKPKNNKMSLNFSFQHYRNDSSGGVDLVNCEKLRGRPEYVLDADNQLVFDKGGNPITSGVNDCSTMFPEDDTYQAVVNVPGKLFLDIMYARARFDYDIKKNLRFVYLGGYENQDRESAQDMEQALNAWDQAMFFLPGTGSTSWMHEIQLQSYGNRKFNWIAGANYFHERTTTIGFFDNPLGEKAMWDQPDRSSDAWALFGQGTYSFSDKWHMTLGYRYSSETKADRGGRSYICSINNGCATGDIKGSLVNGQLSFDREDLNNLPTDYFADNSVYTDDNGTPMDLTDDFQVFTANDNEGSWSHNDWRIGVDYQQSKNTLLYAYLATGFKAGGIGDVFQGTVVDGDVDENGNPIVISADTVTLRTAYEPETVTTFELGLKKRMAKGKLELRGAYFFSDYDRMQYASVGSLAFTESWQAILDANGNPVDADGDGRTDFGWVGRPLVIAYFTQNVPGSQIQGLELEYDSRPWRGGRIHGFMSWLDAEITDDWITKWDYDARSYFGLDFAQAADANNEQLQVNLKGNDLAVSPPFKIRMTIDHAFTFPSRKLVMTPWVTAQWEEASYLTIWNVDRHTDDLDFVIRDEDIQYTDDRRESWSMFHAGLQWYSGNWSWELYGYNLTNEVVQYWGAADQQVTKGSFNMPRTYGFRVAYNFSKPRGK